MPGSTGTEVTFLGRLPLWQKRETLEQIVASVKKVSDIVAEIAAASREQAASIAQVNSAVLQLLEPHGRQRPGRHDHRGHRRGRQ
jgi:Methyl-accepting chemotaxis protein (MCP) signalling domain